MLRGQGMAPSHRQKDLLIHELDLGDLRVVEGDGGQGEIQSAGEQLLLKHLRAVEILADLEGGLLVLLEIAEQQGVEQLRHGTADGHGGAAGGLVAVDDPLALLDAVKGLCYLPVELRPDGREADAPLFPLEQGHPKAFLQLGDGLAEGRLGHMQRLRRPGHILLFRNDLKIVQIGQLHENPSRLSPPL